MWFLKKFLELGILCTFCGCSNSARILGVFMGNGRSHYFMGASLMNILVKAGHEAVLISQYSSQTNTDSQYKEIAVGSAHSDTLHTAMKQTNHNPFYAIDRIYKQSEKILPRVFENADVQLLLNTTFDLVIIEQIFTDSLKVFAWHFKAPLIIFHPLRADIWINSYIGNLNLPSSVPQYPSLSNIHMSFLERLENLGLYLFETILREFLYLREHNEIMKKYFPTAPDLNEIVYNTSLVFLNSDISVDQPAQRVPNMIDIGGFHIVPSNALPNDVTIFLNNSRYGVVFMNLDILTSNYIPEDLQNMFIRVFSELKQEVLWIWDETIVPEQPNNILIKDSSLSQQDVLAHPNIKLFINLGDTQSIIEGVKYGVPQLLIPVLDDQLYNAEQAQYFGYSRTLHFAKLTEKDFKWVIQEMLNNTKYYNESQRRSKIFNEKPITPQQAVKFWVEYIMKTDGGQHLRVASLKYSWCQWFMLDLLGVTTALIILLIFILKYLIAVILRKCCCQTRNYNSDDESETIT